MRCSKTGVERGVEAGRVIKYDGTYTPFSDASSPWLSTPPDGLLLPPSLVCFVPMIRKFRIEDGAQKQQLEMMLFRSVNSIGDLNPHWHLRIDVVTSLDLGLFPLFPNLSSSHSLQMLSEYVEQNAPFSRLVELYPILPNRSSLPSSPSERDAPFLLLAISPSPSTLCYQNSIIDSITPTDVVIAKRNFSFLGSPSKSCRSLPRQQTASPCEEKVLSFNLTS
jgi:hypothetical protein